MLSQSFCHAPRLVQPVSARDEPASPACSAELVAGAAARGATTVDRRTAGHGGRARLRLAPRGRPLRSGRLPVRQFVASRLCVGLRAAATRAWSSCTTPTCTTRGRPSSSARQRAADYRAEFRVESSGRPARCRRAGGRRLRQPPLLRLADGPARWSKPRAWSRCTARGPARADRVNSQRRNAQRPNAQLPDSQADLSERIVSIRLGHGQLVEPRREPRRGGGCASRYGIAEDAVLFGVFGGLTPEKRLPQILDAFRALLPLRARRAPAARRRAGGALRHRRRHRRARTRGPRHADRLPRDGRGADRSPRRLRRDAEPALADRARNVGPVAARARRRPGDDHHRPRPPGDVPSLDPRTWTVNGRDRDRGRGSRPTDKPEDARSPSRSAIDPVCVAIDILDEDHSLRAGDAAAGGGRGAARAARARGARLVGSASIRSRRWSRTTSA